MKPCCTNLEAVTPNRKLEILDLRAKNGFVDREDFVAGFDAQISVVAAVQKATERETRIERRKRRLNLTRRPLRAALIDP